MSAQTKPNPQSLRPDELARLLSAVGSPVSAQTIEADLAAGAPTNPDGTISLVAYAAWLAREAE